MGLGFGFVIQTDCTGLQTAAHKFGTSTHGSVEILENVGAEFAGFGLGMHFERYFGDHTKRTFAAQIKHGQIRPRSVARHRQRADDFAGGGHDFQTHDHIFDFAVFGGQYPGTAVGKEAADGGTRDARGQVHGRKTFFIACPFQMFGIDTRLAGHGQRFRIHTVKLIHALHIHNNTAVDRQGAALRTGAAAPGGDRDLVLIGDFHDARNFFGGRRIADKIGFGSFHPAIVPHFRDPIVVHRVTEAVGIFNFDILCTENVG